MATTFRDDLDFPAGTTWKGTYAWVDEAGTLVDTAGYTALMQIRAAIDDAAPALELSTANGYITVGRVNTGTANQYNVKWSVPASITAAVADFGKGVWSLEITDGIGEVRRLVGGFIWYSAEATR